MISFKAIKRNFKRQVKFYILLYKDKRTPLISRIFLWLALGYFFMPFDLIPDFIPVIGQLDDALVIPGLLFLALKFIPKSLYRKYHKKIFKKK